MLNLLIFLHFQLSIGMRLATYNLRFDSQPNDIAVQESIKSLQDPLQEPAFQSVTTEQPWSTRRIRVAELLLREGTAVAGLQEALSRQVSDLAELFGEEWSWVGVGRDDGAAAGEFSPIFFKKDVALISYDYFWLSNNPFEPSKFPGAGSIRLCTVARFSFNENNKSGNFTILNTHLDDRSDEQRRLAASLLLTRARFEAVKTNSPVFVTGDFNSPSTGPDSGAYNIMTGTEPPVVINATFATKYAVEDGDLPDFKLIDLRGAAQRRRVSANFATYTGFTLPNDASAWTRIDFIFGGSNMGWTVDSYSVESSLSDDGLLASDHRPVFVDISI